MEKWKKSCKEYKSIGGNDEGKKKIYWEKHA